MTRGGNDERGWLAGWLVGGLANWLVGQQKSAGESVGGSWLPQPMLLPRFMPASGGKR